MNSLDASLVALAEAYATHRGISLWRVGALAANRGTFFVDLEKGKRHCRTDTYFRVLQWFSDNWPDPPAWPPDVPRPAPTPSLKEAA